jgi:hypothetical protein
MATQVTVAPGSGIHAIASKGIAGIPAKRIADYITKFPTSKKFELTIENEVFDVTVAEPVIVVPAPVKKAPKPKAKPIAKVTKAEEKKAKILASHAPAKRSLMKEMAAKVKDPFAPLPPKRSHKKKVVDAPVALPATEPVKRSHKKKVVTA